MEDAQVELAQGERGRSRKLLCCVVIVILVAVVLAAYVLFFGAFAAGLEFGKCTVESDVGLNVSAWLLIAGILGCADFSAILFVVGNGIPNTELAHFGGILILSGWFIWGCVIFSGTEGCPSVLSGLMSCLLVLLIVTILGQLLCLARSAGMPCCCLKSAPSAAQEGEQWARKKES